MEDVETQMGVGSSKNKVGITRRRPLNEGAVLRRTWGTRALEVLATSVANFGLAIDSASELRVCRDHLLVSLSVLFCGAVVLTHILSAPRIFSMVQTKDSKSNSLIASNDGLIHINNR